MYLYFYYKSDSQIKFWSDTKQDSNLEEKKLNVSQANFDLLKANWHGYIRDGKLVFEKPAHIEKQEKEDVVSAIKAKADGITTLAGAKEVINQILEIIVAK